jgi:hypothetical protein
MMHKCSTLLAPEEELCNEAPVNTNCPVAIASSMLAPLPAVEGADNLRFVLTIPIKN